MWRTNLGFGNTLGARECFWQHFRYVSVNRRNLIPLPISSPDWNHVLIVSENFQNISNFEKILILWRRARKKYARKVRLYSVRTRNQITSLAMTANSKNSENSKHHQLSSKWIFLYPRHNWSDLLFLFILIVFYYYVLLDVYPPRNFIYILVFPVNSMNNEIIGIILIHGQGPWPKV